MMALAAVEAMSSSAYGLPPDIHVPIQTLTPSPRVKGSAKEYLAFTRDCYAQYCMVYGIQTRGRRGVEYCAIVVQ